MQPTSSSSCSGTRLGTAREVRRDKARADDACSGGGGGPRRRFRSGGVAEEEEREAAEAGGAVFRHQRNGGRRERSRDRRKLGVSQLHERGGRQLLLDGAYGRG